MYSPSGRAPVFAAKHDLVAAFDLGAAAAASDVVITCTSSEVPVVHAADLAHPGRRLVIDLGLPRNVDPAASGVEGVELLDLETIGLHAPLSELNAESEARAIVDDAVHRFHTASLEQSATPALVALRAHVFDVLDAEIERARERGDSTDRTEQALRHLAGVLLHRPSLRARELGRQGRGDEFTTAVGALFGIAPAEPAAPVVPLADRARGLGDTAADAS